MTDKIINITGGPAIRQSRFSRRHGGKVAFSLLVLIFFVTAILVYVAAPATSYQRPEIAVTATVVLPETSPQDDSLEETILDSTNIARATGVLSDAVVAARPQSLAGQSAESIRGNLNVKKTPAVELRKKAGGGRAEIAITYRGKVNPAEACLLVDFLAEQAASQYTKSRTAAAEAEHGKAKQAADNARNELFKIQTRYDTFLNQHFTADKISGQSESEQAGPLPEGDLRDGLPLVKPTPGLHFGREDWLEMPKSPTKLNPRWAELNNKLARLMARRTELLERMTPAHPDVQNIGLEIEDLERQIASVPRETARVGRDSLPPITPMPPGPTDDLLAPGGEGRQAAAPMRRAAQLDPRLQKEFKQKQKELDRAREKYNRLADREREAWQAVLNVPQAEVIAAVCPPEEYTSRAGVSLWLAIVAALAGLCGAAGVGLFSTGVSPPECFETAAQVRAVLKTPVVGTMPAVDSPENGEDIGSREHAGVYVVAAIILVLAAVGIGVWAMLGLG